MLKVGDSYLLERTVGPGGREEVTKPREGDICVCVAGNEDEEA
jgi:hypothetical protein